MELHWGRYGEIYVTPVSKNEVCIASISRDPKLRLTDALQYFPELQARLDGAEVSSTERGAMTTTRKLHRVGRGNVALIGDASGTVDAITGEGLCLAFSQALVLADCLRTGELARYEGEHRSLARRPQLTAQLMLTLDGRPRLQRRALRAFQKRPDIFRRLLALHVGSLSPLHLAMDGLTLGWGLLTA
jgi:flavin-dependent dehydrogenase